ncbi:MAG: tetratricopeptide repeat protein, partial [bacterium]
MAFLSSLVKWGHNRRYNEGILHFNRGEFERAAECFERVLREVPDPNDPDHCLALVHAAEARANLGLAYQQSGDHARAEAEFTRALEENPTVPDLRYQRARLYERSGRVDEAIADLERALDEHPHYMEAHLLLAVCLGARGERERSAGELAEALALGLDAPDWVTPEVAREWTGEQWRRLLPGGGDAAARRGPLDEALARQQAGDLDGAITALAQAVSDKPGYADLRCRLAGLLVETGRHDEALGHLRVALELNPHYLEARLLAARTLLERGQAREAEGMVDLAIEAHPQYPDLWFWLGLARFRAGDLEGAREPLEKAVDLNRQFARAQGLVVPAERVVDEPEQALRPSDLAVQVHGRLERLARALE